MELYEYVGKVGKIPCVDGMVIISKVISYMSELDSPDEVESILVTYKERLTDIQKDEIDTIEMLGSSAK